MVEQPHPEQPEQPEQPGDGEENELHAKRGRVGEHLAHERGRRHRRRRFSEEPRRVRHIHVVVREHLGDRRQQLRVSSGRPAPRAWRQADGTPLMANRAKRAEL